MNQPPQGVRPVNPPPRTEDVFSYRLAVGCIGIALVAFLIGAAVIAAGGKPVPTQYWTAGSAISGALLGILSPTPERQPGAAADASVGEKVKVGFAAFFLDIWKNRELVILMAVFGVSIAFAISRNSAPLETVAAAAGGALVGLLAPPPSKLSGGEQAPEG